MMPLREEKTSVKVEFRTRREEADSWATAMGAIGDKISGGSR